MDKQNFDFKQLDKEEKWKYKKEHKNVFRIQPDFGRSLLHNLGYPNPSFSYTLLR